MNIFHVSVCKSYRDLRLMNIKAILTVGALLVGSSFGMFAPQALADQTCTMNEDYTLECVEDESSDSTPRRSNGEEVPLGSLYLSSYEPPVTGTPTNDGGNGARTSMEIQLALVCPVGSSKTTNNKGEEYCQDLSDLGS